MDCKTPAPPKNTPQMKSQSLPTSNGEGNVHTKEAARMNHREEAEVGIKVLFFFSFFIIKKTIRKKSKCNRI